VSAAAVPDTVELLGELIRFDTTNPPGAEEACVAHVEALLKAAGCETERYERVPGRPNLVSRLRGAGTAPPLLLHGHVDVVTTAGQRWSREPFAGEVADGEIWGRGALDMKSGVAMLVTAFLRAKLECGTLPGDVVLAVVSDEESGGEAGASFLVEEHPELFEGVRHALGEFGGYSMHVGGTRFYPIQVAEKQICWLRARLRGRGGHGSVPQRGGTMARLGAFLRALDRTRLPVHVTPVARQWIETMAAHVPRPHSLALRALLDERTAGAALRAVPSLARLDPVLRNTVNATIVRGGDKINVVPAEVEVELDGRLLPGFGPDDMIRELRAVVGEAVELEVLRHDPAPPRPDLTLLEPLGATLRELDPKAVPVPMLMVGFTDARLFARLGIQTYGFMPLRLQPDFDLFSLIHAADERVPVDAVRFGAEAVFRAVRRYGEAVA
jgi:acetylornithine deacetylase/succinyl-diaminopimelate desuccinylase-like protein